MTPRSHRSLVQAMLRTTTKARSRLDGHLRVLDVAVGAPERRDRTMARIRRASAQISTRATLTRASVNGDRPIVIVGRSHANTTERDVATEPQGTGPALPAGSRVPSCNDAVRSEEEQRR